jgi:hypothetical protein
MVARTAQKDNEFDTLTLVTKLEADASVDPVGTVGGLRIYVPARMAKDSQFPFTPGETATITVVSDGDGPVGLLVTKKEKRNNSERVRLSYSSQ